MRVQYFLHMQNIIGKYLLVFLIFKYLFYSMNTFNGWMELLLIITTTYNWMFTLKFDSIYCLSYKKSNFILKNKQYLSVRYFKQAEQYLFARSIHKIARTKQSWFPLKVIKINFLL